MVRTPNPTRNDLSRYILQLRIPFDRLKLYYLDLADVSLRMPPSALSQDEMPGNLTTLCRAATTWLE